MHFSGGRVAGFAVSGFLLDFNPYVTPGNQFSDPYQPTSDPDID